MSDPRIVGPLSAIGVPIGDALQQHHAAQPFPKNVGLACFGAIVLGYAAMLFAAGVFPPLVLLGVGALGLLLFAIGVRGARGPRDPGMALTSVATPAGLTAALWLLAGPQVCRNVLVLFLPFVGGFVVRLWLSLRGLPGGNAREMVEVDIADSDWNWC
jgi:hypothetical protein